MKQNKIEQINQAEKERKRAIGKEQVSTHHTHICQIYLILMYGNEFNSEFNHG